MGTAGLGCQRGADHRKGVEAEHHRLLRGRHQRAGTPDLRLVGLDGSPPAELLRPGLPGQDPGPFPHGYEQIVRAWIQEEFRYYSSIQSLRVSQRDGVLQLRSHDEHANLELSPFASQATALDASCILRAVLK